MHQTRSRNSNLIARALRAIAMAVFSLTCNASPQDSATTLSGEVELARLLDLCVARLGLDIEYDASSLKGVVTLRLGEGITDDELWLLTNRVLASRGYATVRMPGEDLVSVVKLSEAGRFARVEWSDDTTEVPAGFVTAIARIEHQPVKAMLDALKPILSTGGSVTAIGESNLLLVADLKPRVEEAFRLLEIIDVLRALPVIEPVEAKHLAASQLAALVTAAASARDAVSQRQLGGKVTPVPDGSAVVVIAPPEELEVWRSMIARFDERADVVTRSYAPRHYAASEVSALLEQIARDVSPRGSGDRWKLVVNELTGTIVLTATPTEHEAAAGLIQRLDDTPETQRRGVQSFTLQNRPVAEVMEIVSNLLDAGALADEHAGQTGTGASSERTSGTVGARAANSVDRSARTNGSRGNHAMQLTADEATNTLIAYGETRELARLEELITSLDVRLAQVMVEVIVLSLTDGDTLDLGVEIEKMELSGETMIRLTSLFGLGGMGAIDALPAPGRGFSGVVLNPGDFSIVLRALKTVNKGRSLSLPRTLVNNHEQATLDAVLQEPFTSTNASDTVATTSFGGTQDAGTSVSITPHIAEGDHVVLEYNVTLSSFVGESSDPSLPPPRQQNTLQSKVTIPDGYTIVLGGLELQSDAEAVSKIPLLGDIPGIGEAFTNRSRSSSRTRFYVFIRADVMRHAGFEDLKYLSDRDLIAAEGPGVDDGWPEVKPRIIK